MLSQPLRHWHSPEYFVPDLTESHRDVLGIVRAIAVKERSSAKRKELFRSLQKKAGSKTGLQLILDMIIRWSSTYAMLHRGYTLREYADAAQQAFSSDEGPSMHLAIPALESLHRGGET
ncbi:hypothetical protein B0H13DRAFT_2581604 [Mycena leptocephala]|nr:hypothetical protein B0H13DRAFT_2581604 [Mycena leptocephala]